MYLKNVAGFKMDYFKGMSYDDIRPIFKAKINSNVAFLLKTKEQIEEDKNRALQKLNETLVERAAKRRKLDEEVEELKRHLQIVPNEDDDVYTEATLLARKGNVREARYTCSYMEESKNCTWSSKGQRMEATGIMWCADHNVYIYLTDFVSREEVPAHKIHSRPDAKCWVLIFLLFDTSIWRCKLNKLVAMADFTDASLRKQINGKRRKVTHTLVGQHHERGVCSHGGLETFFYGFLMLACWINTGENNLYLGKVAPRELCLQPWQHFGVKCFWVDPPEIYLMYNPSAEKPAVDPPEDPITTSNGKDAIMGIELMNAYHVLTITGWK
nr:hypothetical protein [Tanacetum cinerariifolium]